jgi:hypothetical protein
VQQKLFASDGKNGSRFGKSVAIYNDLIVVGAPSSNLDAMTEQGAVYIFKRTGFTWTQIKKLLPPGNEISGKFGYDVAVHNGKVLVSSPGKTINGKTSAGAAYLYEFKQNDWQMIKEFNAETPLQDGLYGQSVKMYNNDVVIGYPGNVLSNKRCGSVQVHTRNPINNTWQEESIMPSTKEDHMNFGESVDIYQDTIIEGAPFFDNVGNQPINNAGIVYLYERNNGLWQHIGTSDGSALSANMGAAVAINGPHVFYGIPGAAGGGEVMGGTWRYPIHYTDIEKQSGSDFGSSIAISGNNFIIGAPGKNVDRGSVQFGTID